MNNFRKYLIIMMAPWVLLYTFLLLMLFVDEVLGHGGHYGGLPSVFRIVGLQPNRASISFFAIAGLGVVVALMAVFADVVRAVWEKWMARYPLLRYTPEGIAIMILLAVVSWGVFEYFTHPLPTPPVPWFIFVDAHLDNPEPVAEVISKAYLGIATDARK